MSDPGTFAAAAADEQQGGEPPPLTGTGVVVCLMDEREPLVQPMSGRIVLVAVIIGLVVLAFCAL